METITINTLQEKAPNRANPILLTFQNGTLGPHPKILSVKVSEEKKHKKIEVLGGNNFRYTGYEKTTQGSRLLLIVRKKKSGETKMIEVGKALMINDAFNQSKNTALDNKMMKIDSLKRTFAGKKEIRRFDQSKKLKDVQIGNDSLIESAQGIEIKEEVGANEVSLQEFLPPCDRSATNVTQVYSLRKMFGDSIVDLCLEQMSHWIDHDSEEFSQTLTEFGQKLWPKVKEAKINREEKAFGIVLIDSLLKFLKINVRNLKHSQVCEFKPVHDVIMDIFAVKNGSQIYRTPKMRDKATCYILALLFLVNDYKLQLAELAPTLNLSLKRMDYLCKAIGATAVGKGNIQYELKVPLPPIPDLISKTRRRK